jgi:LemA protein
MTTFYTTVVLGGIALAILVFFSRNKLMRMRQSVEQNWTPLERHLQRRIDVIRKLASVAEPQLMDDPNAIDDVLSLTDTLSGELTIDQHVEFENRLTQSVRRLVQVGDSKYELRGDSRYQDLKRQLAEADLQVTQAARFYNVSAKDYNEVCSTFPCVMVATYLGFGRQPYLQTSMSESEAPEAGLGR